MKILIIIPAYNETANIINVVSSLNQEIPGAHILVVNDASTDDTSSVASSSNLASVIDLPANLGIGGAVQTGFKYAVEKDFDIALQFDGDGQHLASEIKALINPIIKKQADVVIGSRFLDKKYKGFKSTFARRIGIRLFGIINSIIINQKITDNTSGFRAYNKKTIHFLAQNYPVDFPEPETIILLGKNNFLITEIFTMMKKRENGVSSISSGDSFYYMIKVLLAVFINAIRPAVLTE